MTTILLVEDDPELRTALSVTLRSRGHQVVAVDSGSRGIAESERRGLDVIVLDLGLPDMDGREVIAAIRKHRQTPIIVLSARRDEVNKVRALDSGADDYVTKPFGVDELMARVRAAVRRTGGAEALTVATTFFTIDLGTKMAVNVDGVAIHLTPTEWSVLETLIRAQGRLVPTSDLLEEVWGPGHESQSNYLRVYVGQLRRKLEPDPSRPRFLLTAPGMGYRFVAQ